MSGLDLKRFFGWVLALCVLDLIVTAAFGWKAGSFDRNAAYAGFVTILSAIRDDQETRA